MKGAERLKVLKNVNLIMLGVILASVYLSQIQNLILLILVLLFYLIKNDFKIVFNMPGEWIYLLMFLWGICTGIIGLVNRHYTSYVVFKHAYYYILVFLYWHIGGLIIRTKKNYRIIFFRTLLVASVIISLIDIITCISKVAQISGLDINSFRNLMGVGNILSVLGVYLCLIYKEEIELSKNKRNIIIGICVVSSVIHFSRMMILYAAIFVLISGIKLINARWLKYIVIGVLCVGIISSVFPDLTQLFINKLLSSFTEINFKSKIWNDINIVQNWRGYEVSCAIEQFKKNSLLSQIWGSGFGTTLDVKGYAYLVTDDERLSFLHNGYFTQLLIWGILGVVCFFLWIFMMLKKTKNIKFQQDKRFTRSLIFIVLVANYFVMGPFFSAMIASLFFYIGILFELNRNALI